ncbi:MAG: hypothetical protein WC678_02840 [Parcubacteria group bacterium]|jgi:hypothetical protein
MKTLFVGFCSILLASIIISPFFWLKFLRQKNGRMYLAISSAGTLLLFWISLTWAYDFVLNYVNSYDILFYFDKISMYLIYEVIFLIIISPFIFSKLNQTKLTLRTFVLDGLFSALIFVSIFLYWALVLLPKAFSELHNHF